MTVTYHKYYAPKLAKTTFSIAAFKVALHLAVSSKMVNLFYVSSCWSLHNDVDIKMGIIYKNCNFAQKHLKFNRFWSIVFKQCVVRVLLCPVERCGYWLQNFRDTTNGADHIESLLSTKIDGMQTPFMQFFDSRVLVCRICRRFLFGD